MYECQHVGQTVLAQCKQSLSGENVLVCWVSLEIQVFCFFFVIIIFLFLVLFLLFFQLVFGHKYQPASLDNRKIYTWPKPSNLCGQPSFA